jgi:formate dehydrogenase subunit gamma
MGSRELTAHAEKALGTSMPSKSSDGKHSLEAVYCLGNCACSPAVMIDGRVHGRVNAERFDSLLEKAGAK